MLVHPPARNAAMSKKERARIFMTPPPFHGCAEPPVEEAITNGSWIRHMLSRRTARPELHRRIVRQRTSKLNRLQSATINTSISAMFRYPECAQPAMGRRNPVAISDRPTPTLTLYCAKIESNARRRPIVLMVKATEYRFDAQASETAELVPATRGVCWQDAMFRRIRYARPQSHMWARSVVMHS